MQSINIYKICITLRYNNMDKNDYICNKLNKRLRKMKYKIE
jgi:hypothetical protein